MNSKFEFKGSDRVGASDVADVVQTLRRLFRAIHEYSKAIQKDTGLSGPQVWALTLLDSHPGLGAGELAGRMFVHPSTVSGVIERLVKKGAVKRIVDAKDRRSVQLFVTPAGRRILRKSPPPVQLSLTRSLASLPRRRLQELRKSLTRIARDTEADKVRAPLFDLES